MKNFKLLAQQFSTLSTKAKMVTIFVGLVVGIIVLDCLF
jgi:TctA family transporter